MKLDFPDEGDPKTRHLLLIVIFYYSKDGDYSIRERGYLNIFFLKFMLKFTR